MNIQSTKPDTYRGESYAKKIARFYFWKRYLADFQDWKRHPVLVLASRNGGDIQVLRSLGVPSDQIVAIDNNEKAARECSERLGIKVVVADVVSFLKDTKQLFGCVFLDFCGPISDAKMRDFEAAAERVVTDGIVGVAVLRGREKGTAREAVHNNPLASAIEQCGYSADNGCGIDTKDNLRLFKYFDRDVVFSAGLMTRLRGVVGVPYGEIHYTSDTVDGPGSCMVIYNFLIGRYNGWSGDRAAVNAARASGNVKEKIYDRDLNFQLEVQRQRDAQRALVAGLSEMFGNGSMAMTITEAAAVKANVTRKSGENEAKAAALSFLADVAWARGVGHEIVAIRRWGPDGLLVHKKKAFDELVGDLEVADEGSDAQTLAMIRLWKFCTSEQNSDIGEYMQKQTAEFRSRRSMRDV